MSGTGTTRTLGISDITVADGETVSVAIADPSGYVLSGSPQIAVVYKTILDTVLYRELVSVSGGTFNQKATFGTPDNLIIQSIPIRLENMK